MPNNQTIAPAKGYIAPAVLLTMAGREFERAKTCVTWAPDVEAAAHQRLAMRYYAEAFAQYWALRGHQ